MQLIEDALLLELKDSMEELELSPENIVKVSCKYH